ncbi:MAG: hypothetical protein RL153_898, partial [Verrucomicrobiota bacterium]
MNMFRRTPRATSAHEAFMKTSIFLSPARVRARPIGILLLALAMGLGLPPARAVEWFWSGESYDYAVTRGGAMTPYGNAASGGWTLGEAKGYPYGDRWLARLLDQKRDQKAWFLFSRPSSLPEQALRGLDCSFDFLAYGKGSSRGADGLSFNFGSFENAGPTSKDVAIDGSGGGLTVAIRYYTDKGNLGKVTVKWRGTELAKDVDFDVFDQNFEKKAVRCEVKVSPNSSGGQSSITVKMSYVNAENGGVYGSKTIVDGKSIDFNPEPGWRFSIGGGTGYDCNFVYFGRVRLNGSMAGSLEPINSQFSKEGDKVTVSLGYSDPDGNATVTAASDNTALTGAISISGNNLTFTPAAGKSGTANITVTMNSAGATSTRSFLHTVSDVDLSPTMNDIADVALKMNKADDTVVNLSGISAGEGDTQLITLTASSSNKGLVPDPTIDYASPNSFASLRLRAVQGQSGAAKITVTAKDQGGLSIQKSFTVNVASPGFTTPAALSVNEDTGPHVVTLRDVTDGDPSSDQALSLTVTSSIPDLVEVSNVSFNANATAATFSLALKPNANSEVFGNQSADISITLRNADGASKQGSFKVKVNAVADTPLAGMSRGVDFKGTGMAVAGDPGIAGKSFSLEFWGRRNAASKLAPFFSQGTNGLFVGVRADNLLLFGFAGAGGTGLLSAAPYSDTDWHHYAFTYNATVGRRRIYRDGILLASDVTAAAYLGTGALSMGGITGGTYLDGAMQEMRLWQVERSAEEILQWRSSALVPAGLAGLLGYWRADEGPWPRLENQGTKGDALDGIVQGALERVDSLSNMGLVIIPEKSKSYAVSLPAFNADTSGPSGLTYEIVRMPSNGTVGSPAAGQVTYSPNAGFGGTDTISYRVKNGSVSSETVELSLKMNVVDDPPTVSALGNQIVYSSSGPVTVDFTVSDEETDPAQLAVNVTSSDPVSLPVSALELGGQGTRRTVTITPQPDVFASSVVTVTVTDGANSVQRSFTVQLAPTLAYRVIALPGPVGSQVTQPTVIAEDGRVGGFGDTTAGGVPKAFVNLGFLSGFMAQTGLMDQNNGRVMGLASANGLQVSVGSYLINGEWRAFLHNGGSLLNLGKPTGSSGSHASAVNSSLQVVGYSTVGSNEKAFLSTGNPDAFTDISPAGTTTARAIGINDAGQVLIRSGALGSYRAWIRSASGTATDIGAPGGYSSPNPLSISAHGAVMAEVSGSNIRRLARYQSGTWTILADGATPWTYLDGGRMNSFGTVVGTGRTNNPTGTPVAAVYTGSKWYALNDLIPT